MYVLNDALVQVLPQLWSKQRNVLVDFFGSQGHQPPLRGPRLDWGDLDGMVDRAVGRAPSHKKNS